MLDLVKLIRAISCDPYQLSNRSTGVILETVTIAVHCSLRQ